MKPSFKDIYRGYISIKKRSAWGPPCPFCQLFGLENSWGEAKCRWDKFGVRGPNALCDPPDPQATFCLFKVICLFSTTVISPFNHHLRNICYFFQAPKKQSKTSSPQWFLKGVKFQRLVSGIPSIRSPPSKKHGKNTMYIIIYTLGDDGVLFVFERKGIRVTKNSWILADI